MPSYDDLSPEDQAKIDDLLTHVRPAAGTFAQSAHTAKLIGQSGDVTGAKALIDSLDSGTIPNRTGLAEAQPLTPDQVKELLADLAAVAAMYGTPEKTALQIRAAGVNAIIR
tara:strand:+ start:697 stop:1032 length:336 start_codon:yes stop_codon:yes gene_type:complete